MARHGSILLIVLSVLAPAAADASGPPPGSQAFLETVDLLIAPREREAFLRLAGEAERQVFIRRFWEVRDPYPETPRNELEERWTAALPEARRRWGTLEDERARVFLLQGEPSSSFEARCAGHSEGLEFWVYEPRFRVKQRSVLVFRTGDGQGPARLWRPGPGAPSLSALAPESCTHGDKVVKEARWVRLAGEEHYRLLAERALARPRPQPQDWVARFVPLSTELSAGGAGTFDAGLQVDFAGQLDERQVVRVLMTLPRESLLAAAGSASGAAQDLLLTGQVLHNRQVLDTFRYRFRVRPEAIDGQAVPLAFERYLLPGFYKLKIKLENLLSKRSFQDERDLAVPGAGSSRVELVEPAADLTAGSAGAEAVRGEGPRASEVASLFAEAGASLAAREPAVRILPPPGAVVSGNVRLEARVDRVPGLPE